MVEDSHISDKISQLRELVKQEKNLVVRDEDIFYTRFLYTCHGNVEQAFDRLKNYYKIKKEHKAWYAQGDQPLKEFRKFYNWGSGYILEQRDKKGRRLMVGKLGKVHPSLTTMEQHSRFQDCFLETVLDELETQKNGIAVIVDMKDYSWGLMRWLTPGNMRTISSKLDCVPCVRWDYHIVNASFLFYASWKLIHPFLTTRLKESIHIHGNWESLHECVAPEGLPEAFGGALPEPDLDKLACVIFDNDRLEENFRMGYKDD